VGVWIYALSVLPAEIPVPSEATGPMGGVPGMPSPPMAGGGSEGGLSLTDFVPRKPTLGDAAPDFTLRDVEGKTFRLSQEVGRMPVVLEFGSFT
jgi:hypothetical protein